MDAYETISDFIKRLKNSHEETNESEELLEKIVQDSDVFPEEEKEYMYQFMKEEEKHIQSHSYEIG